MCRGRRVFSLLKPPTAPRPVVCAFVTQHNTLDRTNNRLNDANSEPQTTGVVGVIHVFCSSVHTTEVVVSPGVRPGLLRYSDDRPELMV
jgi:hypothetical protein